MNKVAFQGTDNQYKYEWLIEGKWEEIATLMMSLEEDDYTVWFKGKNQEWADMLIKEVDGVHCGDCVKLPSTCLRCVAEHYRDKVFALRALIQDKI